MYVKSYPYAELVEKNNVLEFTPKTELGFIGTCIGLYATTNE